MEILKVPVIDGWTDAEDGLLFDFMEDIEIESDVVAENIVTGYANGIITINVIEADDVARVSARSALKCALPRRDGAAPRALPSTRSGSGYMEMLLQRIVEPRAASMPTSIE